jgi:hypothetical protein
MNKLQAVLEKQEAARQSSRLKGEYFAGLTQAGDIQIDYYCTQLEAAGPHSRKELQEALGANAGWRGRCAYIRDCHKNGWSLKALCQQVSYKGADEAKWYQACPQIYASLDGLRAIWQVGSTSVKAHDVIGPEKTKELGLKGDNRYVRLEHVDPTSCMRTGFVKWFLEIEDDGSKSFFIRQLMRMNPVCYLSAEEDFILKNAKLHSKTPDPLRPWLRYSKVDIFPVAINIMAVDRKIKGEIAFKANKADIEGEVTKSVKSAKAAGWTFEQWVESILV